MYVGCTLPAKKGLKYKHNILKQQQLLFKAEVKITKMKIYKSRLNVNWTHIHAYEYNNNITFAKGSSIFGGCYQKVL